METLVTIAVVSDIHAFASKQNSGDSVLDYTSPDPSNPLTDLIKQAPSLGLSADILVCAGDISNRADAKGLAHAWGDLHKLARVLGGAELIATNGNHDLDSRHLSGDIDPDPKGALLSLEPGFPFADINLSNQYWARNFAVIKHPSDVVIVLLNTSAYHGGRQEEIDHGRVSKRTIEAIRNALKGNEEAKAHVLICHHHPLPLKGYGGGDDIEFIKNGQLLLDELLKSTGSSWLVIHGHRHSPRMIHGATSSNSVPFVFGAGSLGARMPGVPNQFHVLTLSESKSADHTSICGTVESWQWTDITGWTRAQSQSGLPPEFGFGYLGRVKNMSDDIAAICGENFASWDDLLRALPGLRHLMPDSFNELEEALQRKGINLMRDRHGRVIQAGR